jgi:Rrf2 family protein
VNISAKTEYACIAVLELATSMGAGEPVRVGTIAERHGIPPRFLIHILLQLKAAGLVSSTRGAAGGYQLIKEPAAITLGDVMRVIDGQPGELTSNASLSTPVSCVLRDTWRQVAETQRAMLDSVTFAELAARVWGPAENMYYI